MNEQRVASGVAISTVLLLGLLLGSSIFSAGAGGKRANEVGSMGPVPKAECGPSDRTESGSQGQTTSAERSSGTTRNSATTAISNSSASSEGREPFRKRAGVF